MGKFKQHLMELEDQYWEIAQRQAKESESFGELLQKMSKHADLLNFHEDDNTWEGWIEDQLSELWDNTWYDYNREAMNEGESHD